MGVVHAGIKTMLVKGVSKIGVYDSLLYQTWLCFIGMN